MGDHVKGLAEIWVDYMNSIYLIHHMGHLVVEGDEVGQAGLAFQEPILAVSDPPVVPHTVRDAFKMTCSVTFPGTKVRLTGL